jgi:hypothetical protein
MAPHTQEAQLASQLIAGLVIFCLGRNSNEADVLLELVLIFGQFSQSIFNEGREVQI